MNTVTLDKNLIDAHYRGASFQANFSTQPLRKKQRSRDVKLCFFDKKDGYYLNGGQPLTVSSMLKVTNSYMQYAERCFTRTERNFYGIIRALIQLKTITHILPTGNLSFLYEFLAMEIARNPQAIGILSNIQPNISLDVDEKSASIISLIPQLAHALEFNLRWSYWVVPVNCSQGPLICPDRIFTCRYINRPLVSYMMIPISHSHCIVGMKDDTDSLALESFKNSSLLVNFLSYKGSIRFFAVDNLIHNQYVSDFHALDNSVRKNPKSYPGFIGWAFASVLNASNNGIVFNK
jgi:hypothetical protein